MDQGELVDGRFEIERLAGAGGMGQVYAAIDRRTGGRVALKVHHAHDSRAGRASFAERFVLEAELLAELHHPGIVGYVAHGRTAAGALYLAMEWLEGEDLARRLHREPLSVSEAEQIGRRVAEALAALHAHGVVHRDVKPANLLLEDGRIDRVKILDFGVAWYRGALGAATRAGALLGTPMYMAPEQARGDERLDARADVFALGAVLFECLTGRAAFAAEHVMAVLARILLEEAPRVRELRADVPAALDDLVARMLSKEPEDRPRDGAAVADALVAVEAAWAQPARPSAPPPSLGAGEQRLLCVIMSAPAEEPEAAVAATLTPEEASDLIVRLRRVALRFEARVEGLAGGSVVAVLSGTSAATDLAARAARCALAMRAEAPELPLSLATGRGMFAERWPVGEAIDRAVRLLDRDGGVRAGAAGAPLPVRIDDVTAGLLPARFDVGGDDAGLDLRGEREAAPAARTLLGKATPCVGRDPEIARLEGTLVACVEAREARAVLVTAPAGVGKSRLLGELLERIARRDRPVSVWMGRGDPMSAGSAFGLIGQALRHAAGVLDGEPRGTAHRKLRARVQRHAAADDAGRLAVFLGELAGAPAAEAEDGALGVQLDAARRGPLLMGDQMQRAWEDLLAAEAAAEPLLLVLDDLHWGDLPSIKFIDAALRNVPDLPWMVLALGRPEVHTLFPDLWAGRALDELRLAHLSPDASEELVRRTLGPAVTAPTVARLVDRAAGNAFYLEELIRAAASGRDDELPATVLAMVEARIEGLDPTARRVLRAASVFGQIFSRGGAAALLGGAIAAPALAAVLSDLEARELCTRRGVDEYAFRHALLREAAYATLTDADRTLGHRLAGAWLERAGDGEAMAMAEHFERGAEPGRAIAWYRRAAEQALGGDDLVAALARADRAAACGAAGETLGAIRSIQAEAHTWRSEFEAAEACGSEALALLPHGGELWCGAAGEVMLAASKLDHWDRLNALVDEARSLGEGGAVRAHHVSLWGRMANSLFALGRRAQAEALLAHIEDRIAPLEGALDPMALARVDNARSWGALYREDTAGSVRWAEAAVACSEEAGALRNACLIRAGLGAAYREIGALAQAERALREAVLVSERLDLRRVRAGSMHNLGLVLALRGSVAEGLAVEREALAALAAEREPKVTVAARYYLAQILTMAGELEEAEVEARRAVEGASGDVETETTALGVLASVELARGRSAEALEHARQAVDRLAALGQIEEGESRVRLIHAEALHAAGLLEDARAAILDARSRLLARAAKIAEPGWRESFLALPDHARTLELARAWTESDP
jgi:tetratricopeptide (TPR) repeat protein